jgi:transcriptional regulator with XRE-family HTH domain
LENPLEKIKISNEENLRESWQVNLKHFLKSIRAERGLSQSGLGNILGYSDSLVALLESNKNDNRVISSLMILHKLGSLESKNAAHMVKKLIGNSSDQDQSYFDRGILQSLSEVPFKTSYPFEKKLSELFSSDQSAKISTVLSICTQLMSLDEDSLNCLKTISKKLTEK